jgi:hypothetical protein
MTIWDDVLKRCVAIEKEAMLSATGEPADSYPYPNHTQEDFPYFTHRIGPSTRTYDSEQVRDERRIVQIRMFVGLRRQGYTNNQENELHDQFVEYLETVLNAYDCYYRETGKYGGSYLCSEDYPTPPAYLQELGANIISDTGYGELAQSNIGVSVMGTQFNLEVSIMDDIGGY